MAHEALPGALEALTGFVAGRQTLHETLLAVAHLGCAAVDADMAGLTLLDLDGRPTTAVCTAEGAAALDQAQYDVDDGPCLDAYRRQVVNRLGDIAADGRWRSFAAEARARGIRSSLSVPLVVAGEGIGALNFYDHRSANFSAEDEDAGLLFAGQAAAVASVASAYWEQAAAAEGLRQAMASRAVIEQAKGVIMASMGCGGETAFTVLRQQSQAENRKLREIAQEIVDRQRREG